MPAWHASSSGEPSPSRREAARVKRPGRRSRPVGARPVGCRYRAGAMDERRFLEMDDGARIAVTLHFPETPPPWPVVFEARPYRKDDLSDATAIYRRLCDEGDLAVCRADARGTGPSEGDAGGED